VGDTLVIMHGERERRSGRVPYERGILLERTAAAGWWRIGFADHTTKNLRGEQVQVMGSCELHTKFMRAPPEAITEEDAQLRAYFEGKKLVMYGRGGKAHPTPRPLITAAAPRPANLSQPSPPSGDPFSPLILSAANSVVVKPVPPNKQLLRAADVYTQHYRAQEVVDAVVASVRPPSAHARDPDDPWSLYELADYACVPLSSGSSGATQCSPEARDQSAEAGFALDWSYSETASNNSGASYRARPSRFALVRTPSSSGSQSGDRPANFHTFTSGTFGHKMTDIPASACYILPQEFALLQRILSSTEVDAGESPRAPTPLGKGMDCAARLRSLIAFQPRVYLVLTLVCRYGEPGRPLEPVERGG
jgi:hypothetical protein